MIQIMWGDKTLEKAVTDGDVVIYDVNTAAGTDYDSDEKTTEHTK